MTPSVPFPDRERIARLYAPQLEAAEALMEASWTLRPDGIEVTGPTDVRILCLQIYARSTHSYCAAVSLCGLGLPTPAFMLCRSLYEDLVALHWALLPANRDRAVDRVSRQDAFWDELLDRSIETASPRGRVTAMADEEWAALHSEFSGGGKSWFGRLNVARDAVLASLSEEPKKLLNFLSEVINRMANMTLHNTVVGLLASAPRPVGHAGRFYLDYEGSWRLPNEDAMHDAFLAAALSYSWMVSRICEEFGVDAHPLDAPDERVRRAVFELMPRDRRKLSPNSPCWCRSGQKLKKCHGE